MGTTRRTAGTSAAQTVGLVGRVTGRVGPGLLGEVSLSVDGGTRSCVAHLAPPADRVLEVGTQVLVTDAAEPRTVWVVPLA